jgi:hypothetical protein
MLFISSHKGNENQNHTKTPPQPCWNSYHQKHHQQVLVRMWKKRNPHTLLMGMQTSTTTLQKKIGGFLKIRI